MKMRSLKQGVGAGKRRNPFPGSSCPSPTPRHLRHLRRSCPASMGERGAGEETDQDQEGRRGGQTLVLAPIAQMTSTELLCTALIPPQSPTN